MMDDKIKEYEKTVKKVFDKSNSLLNLFEKTFGIKVPTGYYSEL